MKYISLLCVALIFIATSSNSSAQPQSSMDCGPSDWNGVGEPTTDSYAYFCEDHSAPKGMYLYYNAEFPDPESWQISIPQDIFDDVYNMSNIYGLKGKNGIGLASWMEGEFSAQVFESQFVPSGAFAQTPDNNEFKFTQGNFRFNTFYVDAGTVVKIQSGATVVVQSVLKVDAGAILEIEPGGQLILESSADHQCLIDARGSIEGNVTKEFILDMSNAWQAPAGSTPADYRTVFNPGLYDVDMRQFMSDVSDALAYEFSGLGGEIQYPYIQLGFWHKGETESDDYNFVVTHNYESPLSTIQLDQTNLDPIVREASLAPDGILVTSQGDEILTSSLNGIFYNQDEGVGILPIYNQEEANSLNDWNSNPDIISFNGNISNYKTPLSFNRPFVLSISNVHPNVTGVKKIRYSGKYDTDINISIVNKGYDANSTSIFIPGVYGSVVVPNPNQTSLIFENSVELEPNINTLPFGDLLFYQDIYSLPEGNATSNYRGIDFSGYSVLNNNSGNIINLPWVVQKLHQTGFTDMQYAFYDIKNNITRQDARLFEYAPGLDSNMVYEETGGAAHPHIVANYAVINDPSSAFPGFLLCDIYNIKGIEVFNAMGDELRPDDAVALNFHNPVDPQQYNGIGYDLALNNATKQISWQNMGGIPTTVFPGFDTTFADTIYANPYDKYLDRYHFNKPALQSMVENTNNVSDPIASWENTIQNWDQLNAFTLFRLGAITASNDTVTLATLPVSFRNDYSTLGADPLETSVAPNPMFYLLDPYDSDWTTRKLGAYSRGDDNAVSEPLTMVIDFDQIDYYLQGYNISSYFVDAPIQQDRCELNAGYETQLRVMVGDEIDENWSVAVSSSFYQNDHPTGLSYPTSEYGNADFLTVFLNPLLGDFNGDGCVTTSDLLIFLGAFGTTDEVADFNCDGLVTNADLLYLLSEFDLCSYGDGANMIGTDDYNQLVEFRMSQYANDHKNHQHLPYDPIADYPDFTTAQRTFLTDYKIPVVKVVTDEFNVAVHHEIVDPINWSDPTVLSDRYNVTLHPWKWTSDELAAVPLRETGNPIYDDAHYKYYIVFDQELAFPGIADPVKYICLGCAEDPNNPFTSYPTFVAN